MGSSNSSNIPTCIQQQPLSPAQINSSRFTYQQNETSPLIADGGIVYLGEIGGGSGSGGSRIPAGSRRPRRRPVDTQSSSSFGGGPSTRGAQSTEGAPCTASNSSHSIGPSRSSSRATTGNNPSANGSTNVRPSAHHYHHHHHHRRRRPGSSGKQSTRNHPQNSNEKIAFPVEL